MTYRTNATRLVTLTFLGILAGIFIFSIPRPSYYELLPVIPVTYSFLNIFFGEFVSNYNMRKISIVMFNCIAFFRAVLMPVLLALGGFVSTKTINIRENMPRAIILFTYVMILEFCIMYFMNERNRREFSREEKSIKTNNDYKPLIMLLIICLGVCLILAPMATGYYRTIFGIGDFDYTAFDSRELISKYATDLFSKFGLITFRYIANIFRLVFPCIIIVILKEREVPKRYVRFIVLLLVTTFCLFLVDDTIASSLVNVLVILIFYNRLYSRPEKVFSYLLIAFGIIIAYFSLRVVLTSSSQLGTFYLFSRYSNYAQAYFSGVNNISAGFNLGYIGFLDKIKFAIYEVLKGIPYSNTIFGLDSTNISKIYNLINQSTGQIVPTISSGTLYFGFFIGPIYNVTFLILSFIAGRNLVRNDKPLLVLSSIVICIYSLMGTSMYSPEATWSFLFSLGLPIRLLSRLFEK